MKENTDYQFEKAAYQMLKQHNLADHTMPLIDHDDPSQTLVILRGECDLATFTELRR